MDVEYFSYLRELLGKKCGLEEDIEIVSYDGKNALTNTLLVSFVLKNFERLFFTFDLDSAVEVKKCLDRLGLKEKRDYLAIGKDRPGRMAIEGLLPERVITAVFSRETDLSMQLASSKSSESKAAKAKLKRKLLEEFKSNSDYSEEELKDFMAVGRSIGKALA